MRIFRGFLAVVCFVLGLVSLAVWAASTFMVRAVEDGTMVTAVAQKVVQQPWVTNLITEQAQSVVKAKLAANGIDLASVGLQGTLDDAIAAAIDSDAFRAMLRDSVDGARADLARQLTDPAAEGQPLVLQIDVGATINRTIAEVPLVGSFMPTVAFDPVPVPVADAREFDQLRRDYRWIHRGATWAGWVALLFIAAGIALTPRKRWLLPLALLFAGLGGGALWAALRLFSVDRIVGALPADGLGGHLRDAIVQYAPQHTIERFGNRVLLASAACLIAALVAFIIVKVASRPARRRADAVEAHHPHRQHE
ncbi:MAG TPA: hypothetical protein VF362_02485, partial [Demequinaceae bacterium]